MNNKRNKIIQKAIFISFLLASAALIITSLCYVSSTWLDLKAEKNNVTTGFWNLLNDLITSIIGSPRCMKPAKEAFNVTNAEELRALMLDPTGETLPGFYRNLWFDIQAVNNLIFYSGLVMLALTAVCAITGCIRRKKYYISNLVSGIVTGATGITLSVITIIKSASLYSDLGKIGSDIELYQKLYNIQMEVYGDYAKIVPVGFSNSNALIGVIVPAVYIIFCCGLIAYVVFKFIKTNKKENLCEGVVINA